MALYALGDTAPQIHPTAYVHPAAQLIGDVVLHAEASVWPGAVLRADFNRIEVGEGSAVEDNTMIHPVGRGRPSSARASSLLRRCGTRGRFWLMRRAGGSSSRIAITIVSWLRSSMASSSK